MDGLDALSIQPAVTRQLVHRIEPRDPLAFEPVAIWNVWRWIIEGANVKLSDVLAREPHGLSLPGQGRSAVPAKCPFDARGRRIELWCAIRVSNLIRIEGDPDNGWRSRVMSAIVAVTISDGHRLAVTSVSDRATHAATGYRLSWFVHLDCRSVQFAGERTAIGR
jgi:hypothetical protein